MIPRRTNRNYFWKKPIYVWSFVDDKDLPYIGVFLYNPSDAGGGTSYKEVKRFPYDPKYDQELEWAIFYAEKYIDFIYANYVFPFSENKEK